MTKSVLINKGITSTAKKYKAALLDAYGVFWGSNAFGALEGAKEAMEALVSQGKIVGVLSNASQLSLKEIEKLKKHGIFEGIHFHFFVTSGQIAREMFLNEELPFKLKTHKFAIFGKAHPAFSLHKDIFFGTKYEETSDLEEADFIYVSVPHVNGENQVDKEIFREEVLRIKKLNLPMVCSNPDLVAHEGNPMRSVIRQGTIASMYKELGGEVFYIGKPHFKAYEKAMEQFKLLGILNPQDILMVGDTPETDIRGARAFGMKSALIVDAGVMKDRIKHEGFDKAISQLKETDYPDYFIERFINEV